MRRDWLGRRKTEYLTAGIQERAAFYTEGMVWSFPLHFSTTLSRALQHPQERRFPLRSNLTFNCSGAILACYIS